MLGTILSYRLLISISFHFMEYNQARSLMANLEGNYMLMYKHILYIDKARKLNLALSHHYTAHYEHSCIWYIYLSMFYFLLYLKLEDSMCNIYDVHKL